MSERLPISEQITAAVAARMLGLRQAGEYFADVAVERFDPFRGNTPANNKVIVYEGDDRVDSDPPSGRFQYLKEFALDLYVRVSESSAYDADRRANVFRAEVEKAIMTDPFWSAIAVNTFLRGCQRWTEDGHYGITVLFDVQYQVSETDPYSRT